MTREVIVVALLALFATAEAARHAPCSAQSRLRGRTAAVRASAADDDESAALNAFREQLQRQMGGGGAGAQSSRFGSDDMWARASEGLETGAVLVADHTAWREGAPSARGAPYDQFALRGPLPPDARGDLLARVLPVVILVSRDKSGGFDALLLERRTGILLGDIKGDEYAVAPINPLWFGGVQARDAVMVLAQHDGPEAPEGFEAVFTGVAYGPWGKARPLIESGKIMATRSMVFAGKTVFKSGELEKQLDAGLWRPASVSRDVLFKERSEPSNRPGSKPLWREILELCAGEYGALVQDLYGDDL